MPAPTEFRFAIDYEEWDSDGRALSCGSMWAPNAKQALRDFIHRHAGTRGFLGIDSIDPMPTHVRIDGEAQSIPHLGRVAYACAMSVLAEQSGCRTPAEARFYIRTVEDDDDAKALGKLLLAEWQAEHAGAELVQALAGDGAPRMRAAE